MDDFPNFPWKVGYVFFPKNRGKTPKMDGLFHGKPYEQIPWILGGFSIPFFWFNTHMFPCSCLVGISPSPEFLPPSTNQRCPRKGTHRRRDIGQPQLQLLPVPAPRDPSVATNVGWPVSAVYILIYTLIYGERYKKHRVNMGGFGFLYIDDVKC